MKYNDIPIVEFYNIDTLLTQNGINAELVNDTQQSALMLAIQNGRIRFAKYLMLKGVQVEISKVCIICLYVCL